MKFFNRKSLKSSISKKYAIIIICLFLLQSVSAMSVFDAKEAWRESRDKSQELQKIHQEAKVDWAADKTPENNQRVVETGKDVLHAALDEVEAWLTWKEIEAQENKDVPEYILDDINNDIDANRGKIADLRSDIDGVDNQLELGLVFLKMIGKYFELISDVARNSGSMWVHIGDQRADKIEEFEEKLRSVDNPDAEEYLNQAREELEQARDNLRDAEEAYNDVRIPGTPLIKFAEGNNYIRNARFNLINAHKNLQQAYRVMLQ